MLQFLRDLIGITPKEDHDYECRVLESFNQKIIELSEQNDQLENENAELTIKLVDTQGELVNLREQYNKLYSLYDNLCVETDDYITKYRRANFSGHVEDFKLKEDYFINLKCELPEIEQKSNDMYNLELF